MSKKNLFALLVFLLVAGVISYYYTNRQPASIDIVQPGKPVSSPVPLSKKYTLVINSLPSSFQTTPSTNTHSNSSKAVSLPVGRQGAFNLVVDKISPFNSPQFSGIEGVMTFDPSMIKITSFTTPMFPVTLKKWSIKRISPTKAELSFAYGVQPNGSFHPRLELPQTQNDNDKKTSYFSPTLLRVRYQVLKSGSTTISFPVDKLKLAALNQKGNLVNTHTSRLTLNIIGGVLPKPIPSSSPLPPYPIPHPSPTPTPTPQSNPYDLNHDNRLNLLDYNVFLRLFTNRNLKIDFNHDKQVDIFDYSLFLQVLRQAFTTY